MDEDLAQAVMEILQDHPEGLGEHRFMTLLGQRGLAPYAGLDFHDPLALFQAHFLLFHLLHVLRDRFHAEKTAHLEIHTLAIRLGPYRPGRAGLAADDPLHRYYLDLEQLKAVDRTAVEAMLERFWKGLDGRRARQKALAELDLSDPVGLDEIRERYRRLAARHHPDRGGDPIRMQRLNAAWRVLSGKG